MRRATGALGLRARLLGLVALMLLPILLANVLFAYRAYKQNLSFIDGMRAQIINDFAVRSRIWFRGASRTLLAAATTVLPAPADGAACSERLMDTLRPNSGYRMILILRKDAPACLATLDATVTVDELITLAGQMAAAPELKTLSGGPFAPVRYGSWSNGGRSYLVIHVLIPDHPGASALLLADPQVIDATFEIGPLEGAIVGLISQDGDVLAQRGAVDGQAQWLPMSLPSAASLTPFEAQARDGTAGLFAAMPVADSPLGVIARFSREAETEAWRQYMFMAATPLAAALFLFLAYMLALQRDVLRWILGIKQAARARINDAMSETLAPVSDDMPRELRSVATAFNTMVRDSHAREAALTRSLADNRFLMRELHHRVKNSLQVIQSYLSLSQREAGRARRGDLAETEARVLVLSIAYRLALSEDGMRPVALRPLAEEVVTNLTNTLRADSQWVSLLADIDGTLEVDRAIPFGLAIVEGVIAALRSPRSETVQVTVAAVEPQGHYRLCITARGAQGLRRPSARILQGLALQLQAQVSTPGEEEILDLTFAS